MKIFKKLLREIVRLKKLWVTIAFLLLVTFGGNYIYEQYLNSQAYQTAFNAPPKVKYKDGTNINPAFSSSAAFKKHLQDDYPFVYEASFESWQDRKIGKNYIIPGLLKTKTLNLETGKLEQATFMTPQGLTVAGDYVLISAYDGERNHASVIYVLDRKSGKFIKNIILNGRPHVGGLAYDPVAKNVWITGSKDEAAMLATISLKKIKKYDYAKDKQPISYDYNIALPTIERASTVTYYDNQLFVAFFNAYEQGTVASYTIARSGPAKGTITNDEIRSTTGELTMSFATGESEITNQIQGIAVNDDRIFLTQSYGGNDAKLYIYPISAIRNLDPKNAERVIPMPPYLEQVYVENNQMLALFESGSRNYARDTILIMDRVLALNINALLK